MAVKPLSQTVVNIPHFKINFNNATCALSNKRTTTMMTKKIIDYEIEKVTLQFYYCQETFNFILKNQIFIVYKKNISESVKKC